MPYICFMYIISLVVCSKHGDAHQKCKLEFEWSSRYASHMAVVISWWNYTVSQVVTHWWRWRRWLIILGSKLKEMAGGQCTLESCELDKKWQWRFGNQDYIQLQKSFTSLKGWGALFLDQPTVSDNLIDPLLIFIWSWNCLVKRLSLNHALKWFKY